MTTRSSRRISFVPETLEQRMLLTGAVNFESASESFTRGSTDLNVSVTVVRVGSLLDLAYPGDGYVAFIPGSAKEYVDYNTPKVATGGPGGLELYQVSFPGGLQDPTGTAPIEQQFSFQIVGVDQTEATKSFSLVLFPDPASGTSVGPKNPSETISIVTNYQPPAVHVADATVSEVSPDGGPVFASFLVTRTGPLNLPTVLQFGLLGSTSGIEGLNAIPGVDYTDVSGPFTIPAGASQAVFQVPVLDHPEARPTVVFQLKVLSVDNGSIHQGNATGTITEPPVFGFDVGTTAVEGSPITQPIATFDSYLPNAFKVSVDYGDGISGVATVSSLGQGEYGIYGTHTYLEEGNPILNVSLSNSQGLLASGDGFAIVKDAPLTAHGAAGLIPANGIFTNMVALFTDANPFATATDFSATIYWGDGSSSPGSVIAGPGGFDVLGSHAYSVPGTQTPLVVIFDKGGATATATAHLARVLPTPLVTGFSLLDVSSGKLLGPLANNATISLSALHIKKLDIGINVTNAASVTCTLNGRYVGMTSTAPFTLLKADPGLGSGIPLGTYTVVVQPFSGPYAEGTAGAFTTIHFKVVA